MGRLTIRCGIGLLLLALMASGAPGPTADPNTLMAMSLEELMEVPVVVSASRQEQKVTEVTVPITVITAEDIHASGLTSLPEILMFAAGVDVVTLSRIRSAVGVRGLHDFVADRTLTLINGRPADSAIFGGSEFYRYPILVEDIERIEIVRGPGGAAWGANAFTGVINIITKKPGETPGWLVSSGVTEYGDTYNHLRWMERKEALSWRMSVGYEDTKDSEAAGAGKMVASNPALNGLIGFDDMSPQDYGRNVRLDTEFDYAVNEDTNILFGSGYSHFQRGDWEFLGHLPGGHARYETSRNFLKLNHTFDDESSGYLQWTGNYNDTNQPSLFRCLTAENDFETQYNRQIDAHALSIGGNIRITHLETRMLDPESLAPQGGPFDDSTLGLFVMDRFKINDRWTVEGQLRGDRYTGTQYDWSTRLSSLVALDEARDHVWRTSFAKAYRSPFIIPRNDISHRVYHPLLGTYLLNIAQPAEDLDNEETWALETGLSSRLAEGVLLSSNVYYQRFEHLIAYRNNNAVPTVFYPENIDGADSWGSETELAYDHKFGRLALWYAYNDFQTDTPDQPLRTYKPSRHKAGLTNRWRLPGDLTANINYRYTDTTGIGGDTTLFPVDMSHRLDVTLARAFAKEQGEFMIGVTDILNETHGPNYTVGSITSYETPGRTLFARLQLRW